MNYSGELTSQAVTYYNAVVVTENHLHCVTRHQRG